MLGKSLLWVAKQHGHSVEVMLRMYAAWNDGAIEADIEAIRQAMEGSAATRAVATPVASHHLNRGFCSGKYGGEGGIARCCAPRPSQTLGTASARRLGVQPARYARRAVEPCCPWFVGSHPTRR